MILVPFIYFILLMFVFWYKGKQFGVASYIALIYAISAFYSILIDWFGVYGEYGVTTKVPIHFLPTLTYCVLITISIWPFYKLQKIKNLDIPLSRPILFTWLGYFFIFVFFITIFVFLDDIRSILNGDLSEVRAMIYDEDAVETPTGWRYVLELFPTIFSRFSPMILIMFFYSILKLNNSKLYNYLLFVASFTPVVAAILVAGRTQIIYWILIYGALYVFFRPFLDKSKKRTVLLPVLVATGILGIYFMAVTASRWGESSDSSMTAYLGQSFLNFSYFFDHYSCREISFQRIFPFTYHFVLGQKFDLTDYRETIFAYSGENIGIFYSFLGDWLVDLGHGGMILLVIIYACVASLTLKQKRKGIMPFYQLMLWVLLLQVPLFGVFYYSFWRIDMSYYILGTIVLYLIFRYSIKKEQEC